MKNTPEQTALSLIREHFSVERYESQIQGRRLERLIYFRDKNGPDVIIEKEKELILFGEQVITEMKLMAKGWISIKERLPEPNSEVNVLINRDSVGCAVYESIGTDYGFVREDYDNFSSEQVTHWQPLPTI